MAGLLLSLVINFGGVAYYVNQDKRTAQQLHDLGLQIEAMKKVPPAPVKVSDDSKYIIASHRILEGLNKELGSLRVDFDTFKKSAEPRFEKIDRMRR